MSWFELDPQSISARVKASGAPANAPTLAGSLFRGMAGFTIVSAAGFMPWVLAGKWFYRNPGELTMYASCAAIFMGLSGLILHPLIIGPGSLKRFYIFFSVAFGAYAAGWIGGWMGLSGQTMHLRSIVGLLIGTAIMGNVFGIAFDARGEILKIIAALFVLNSLGYFVGGLIEGALAQAKELNLMGLSLSGAGLDVFMKAMWGVCYGLGFGAGLGLSFYAAQCKARALLSQEQPQTSL